MAEEFTIPKTLADAKRAQLAPPGFEFKTNVSTKPFAAGDGKDPITVDSVTRKLEKEGYEVAVVNESFDTDGRPTNAFSVYTKKKA